MEERTIHADRASPVGMDIYLPNVRRHRRPKPLRVQLDLRVAFEQHLRLCHCGDEVERCRRSNECGACRRYHDAEAKEYGYTS